MSMPSASYSITMRVILDAASTIPDIATAVADAGGLVTALDVVEPIDGHMVPRIGRPSMDPGAIGRIRRHRTRPSREKAVNPP